MIFRVKNVLGVREAVLDFSKPVVLYGRNGGGKSSAIRSLLLAVSPLQKNGIEEQRWDRLGTLANIGGDIWNYISMGSAVVAETPEKDGKKYGIDESGFDHCKGFENTVVDRFPTRLLPLVP
jgi:AAA15 family ATPase/GTPase